MAETKQGLLSTIRSFPRQFWVANTMEIFERMSWYGWFTVMALYVTGSVETGGLGFTTETRGALQAIVPFFLYLPGVHRRSGRPLRLQEDVHHRLPGDDRRLLPARPVHLAARPSSWPSCSWRSAPRSSSRWWWAPWPRSPTSPTRPLGFGIFYMMVNIGGFVGPDRRRHRARLGLGVGVRRLLVLGRWSTCSSCSLFYKEPTVRGIAARRAASARSSTTWSRCSATCASSSPSSCVLFALMFANLDVWHLRRVHLAGCCMVHRRSGSSLNFVWDRLLPKGSGDPETAVAAQPALMQRMHCSNWRFALFLLIMSGFWTSFNQIFYTMPEYIRDFIETRPMIAFVENDLRRERSRPIRPSASPARSPPSTTRAGRDRQQRAASWSTRGHDRGDARGQASASCCCKARCASRPTSSQMLVRAGRGDVRGDDRPGHDPRRGSSTPSSSSTSTPAPSCCSRCWSRS